MTERLYYHDSFLLEFDAQIAGVVPSTQSEPRSALILDRTAFYPTSGGQVFDTGWLMGTDGKKLSVLEVAERDDGTILHFMESADPVLQPGTSVRGQIDAARRRDHMQQHSGQHVLSAALVQLFNMPTVSFHMGTESCSIDLDTKSLSREQVEEAERLANEVIRDGHPVMVRFVSREEAQTLGLRKIPPAERGELRLIDVQNFDLTACGGTHVRNTSQIGCILLRKTEKVKQGVRLEFVCGERALATSRRDYKTLTEAAAIYSSHIWELPQQARKALEEAKTERKGREQVLAELAGLMAQQILSETVTTGQQKHVVRVFPDRDLTFLKLLAQKLTRAALGVVALLGSTADPPALVFAQSVGSSADMGSLMKQALATLGGRGGGSKDMAQGGPGNTSQMSEVLNALADSLPTS
jgi:alanyl-tRNA synthetase